MCYLTHVCGTDNGWYGAQKSRPTSTEEATNGVHHWKDEIVVIGYIKATLLSDYLWLHCYSIWLKFKKKKSKVIVNHVPLIKDYIYIYIYIYTLITYSWWRTISSRWIRQFFISLQYFYLQKDYYNYFFQVLSTIHSPHTYVQFLCQL